MSNQHECLATFNYSEDLTSAAESYVKQVFSGMHHEDCLPAVINAAMSVINGLCHYQPTEAQLVAGGHINELTGRGLEYGG